MVELLISFKISAILLLDNIVKLMLIKINQHSMEPVKRIIQLLKLVLLIYNILVTIKILKNYHHHFHILGELCDNFRGMYECGFGYRKCLAKRCYGYLST